jgi:Ca2+-binding EF-hand superfamily protein
MARWYRWPCCASSVRPLSRALALVSQTASDALCLFCTRYISLPLHAAHLPRAHSDYILHACCTRSHCRACWVRLRRAGKAKRGWEAAKSRGAPAARRGLLKKVWDDVDEDGSGTLDQDELKSVLLRMGRKEEDLDIDEVMRQVDDDGSGDVDFREFTEWFLQMEMNELDGLEDALAKEELIAEVALDMEEARAQREAEEAARLAEEERVRAQDEQLERVWKEVDKDGSGELDAGELKVVLLRMGRNDDIDVVMKEVDKDGRYEDPIILR